MENSSSSNRFDLGGSIVGFKHLHHYSLTEMASDSPYFILRSLEEQDIEYLVISPFEAYKEYEFQIGDELKEELSISSPDEVLVLSIVTVHNPFHRSTLNLLAPLVFNLKSGKGRQIILNGYSYAVNAALFPHQQDGGA